MNLSTRQLRAFIALADEANFTRAAERSHLSQPAFSALIRSVEEVAGTRLFDRTTRHVELTPEGRLFAASARRLLADFDSALAELHDHVERRQGRASLAALPSLAAGWLPPVLADFQRDHPGIELQLRDALLEQCLDMVRQGRVDFAVAAQGADMTDFATELLCTDGFYLVCRRDHPLARRRSVSLRDVAGHPVIQMAGSSSVRQHLEPFTGPLALGHGYEVEHLATVNGLVAAGLGVSMVPAMTLFHFRNDDVVTLPLRERGLRRSLYLVRRRGRSLSVAAAALWDRLLARRPQGAWLHGGERNGVSARQRQTSAKPNSRRRTAPP